MSSDDDAVTDGRDSERDPLDLLVEEFTRRLRNGESVDVPTFAAAHPEQREALLELLPTLQALEQVKRDRESTGGQLARVALPEMHRLGDFRIVTEVGRGGMGVVFEAFQESLSRRVALKVLPQASLLTGNQLMRFQREAQVAAQLHHSNIVPVFGSGETDGYHWYAMQFISGTGLDAWRKAEGQHPPKGSAAWRDRARFVARIGAQVAEALHYAHEHGTLHRDIKPGNLLLGEGEHVWVTDFGLAKALEAEGLTQSGDLLGTMQYMAPEQFAGIYDARSEVYALGITLYELLTLRPAYAGQSRSELLAAIQRGRPTPVSRLVADVPRDLETVIGKATASDPADRYSTAEELEQDLVAFLEDRPIAARRQSSVAQVLRWCRRNRAMAGLLAATLTAIVVAGGIGWGAYVVTSDALARAETAGQELEQERLRAEGNLRHALAAFEDVFDGLVGRDPLLMFEADPDTGEEYVVAVRNVRDQDLQLLLEMLSFYDDFAAQNAASQSLRFETARAHRRVGVIHKRLGNLEEAAAAYDEALELYSVVSDRDIARELAAVHLEYGHLEMRRRNREEAARRFQLALQVLTAERERTGDESVALQFECATVQYELARTERLSRRGRGDGRRRDRGERPSGERPSDAPPDGPREGRRGRQERLQRALGYLADAQATLAALPAAERGKPEVRALEARCLLLAGQLQPLDTGLQSARAGLQILREIVATNPDLEQSRLEFCDTVVDLLRVLPRAERLALLEEAAGHAARLVKDRPDLRDHRALRSRVAGELGSELLYRARTAGEADRPKLLARAERELRRVVAEPGAVHPMRAVGAIRELDNLLREQDRAQEADALLERAFAQLREAVEVLVEDGARASRPERWGGFSAWGRGDRGEGRGGRADPRRDPGGRRWRTSAAFDAKVQEFRSAIRELMPRVPPQRGERRPDGPRPGDGPGRGR